MGNYLNPDNSKFQRAVNSIAENVIRKNCLKDWKFQKRADLKSI